MTSPALATTTESKKHRFNVIPMKGRIESSRQYQGNYYTRITTPAKDEFAKPSQFEIRSKSPLGDAQSMFQGFVEISGFIRDRKFTDKTTGEVKEYADKTVILDLVV
jgi:hypothetical protein